MDLATPTVTKVGNNLYVSHGTDANVWPEFYTDAVKNEYKSDQAGHPVYGDHVFVKITFPGDKTKVFVECVTDQNRDLYIQRFPKQWEAFQRQVKQVGEGMPVEEWAALGKSEVMQLKVAGIFTVEMLAAIPDTALTGLGWRDLRAKAQAWLNQAKDGSAVTKLTGEISALHAEIEAMKHAAASPRRGRPPLNKEDE